MSTHGALLFRHKMMPFSRPYECNLPNTPNRVIKKVEVKIFCLEINKIEVSRNRKNPKPNNKPVANLIWFLLSLNPHD